MKRLQLDSPSTAYVCVCQQSLQPLSPAYHPCPPHGSGPEANAAELLAAGGVGRPPFPTEDHAETALKEDCGFKSSKAGGGEKYRRKCICMIKLVIALMKGMDDDSDDDDDDNDKRRRRR